ncbi:PAS domain-containing hybrid sensor histidine kinase/response regulator [Leptolyngbya ohadii]|uniref:PAS domain-containing hybrid sensor histidine kinase/response regulator n=1 Tax=Leptolyngbya ohadii TaxID=1962290 RepID=UPI0019D4B7F6|nr:PAS domain S-box protein [Leptolyngbya ohadii]
MDALTASEMTFFFDRSLDLLSVIGLDGYIRRVNPKFAEVLGYSKAALLSQPFIELVHPDDHAATLAEVETLKAGAPTLYFENRYRTVDGDYRWLAWTASPQVEQGVMYCVARDITGQKAIEAERQSLEAALQRANLELEQRVADRTAALERINAALRESEERNHLAMTVARMFTFEWEPVSDRVCRSAQGNSLLGLTDGSPQEDTGSNWFQRIHPEDQGRFTAILQALTPENSTYHITYRVVQSESQEVVLEESARALFDADGQFIRLIGITADVTERHQLQFDLEASREVLQRQLAEIETIYQSAPVGLAFLDPDLRFVRINQQLAEINGLSVEDHLGRGVQEALPEIAERLEPLLRQVIESAEPIVNLETQGTTFAQPGVERNWLASYYPQTDPNGQVVGINTVVQEITERKATEAALRQSEERYRTLFESIEDGFCIIQMQFDEDQTPIDYQFLEINPAFERQAGLTGATGKTVRQLLPDLESFWLDTYGKVALAQEAIQFENYTQTTDRWIEVSAFPTGHSEEHKVAVLFRDISDRKSIETQRERLLQQEQTARSAAEYANRMKDEFLAVLSHELRTPLNAILGWAQLLQLPQTRTERLHHGLAIIERNAKHQVQLVEDLLDVSKVVQGKLTLHFAAVDLAEPIKAALETVEFSAQAKDIRFKVCLDPLVRQVKGDAGRLQQVIWNLFSNAVKFTPQGGRVTVHLTQDDHHAQIQVSDTGKGIEPEFLPHVFELFRQQDSSTTRAFGGLGLGLAIAHQVVEAHSGTITAASDGEGSGATFTVRLPLLPAPPVPMLAHSELPQSSLHNLRVLAVDDELDSLELIRVSLEQEGAIVTPVTSARAALAALDQQQFDLLISDIGMPQMEGYALIRVVRQLPDRINRQIPAIALTAYVGEANQRQVLEAGFQAHAAKPMSPQLLVDLIKAVISK